MQFAGSKDGGWAYTEGDLEGQNGNSGLTILAPDLRGGSMTVSRGVLVLLCASCAWSGTLSYVYDFEPPLYTGSDGGTPLAGQNGWYVYTGSVDGIVLTYQGVGAPVPPNGGTQFVGMVGPSARDAHTADFSAASIWSITFDVLADNQGQSYGNPIGAFALFHDTLNDTQFSAEADWDGNSGSWSMVFNVYGAGGGAIVNGQLAGSAFSGLSQDHWYQEQFVFDTAANRILNVSITDPGNFSASYSPAGWYLSGGASAAFSANAFRLVGRGTEASPAAMGFDDILIQAVPEPATWTLLLAGIAALCWVRSRRAQTAIRHYGSTSA